jgi:hypothetical protein
MLFCAPHPEKSAADPEDVFSVNTFDELQLDARMVKNLADLAITQLTTIQARALPVILGGKDALVKSQTGSGKTLTYAVPIMQVIVVLFLAVLRIHAILGWIRIRIRGSMPLTNGSGFGSGSWIRILLLSSLTLRCKQKTIFYHNFFCLLLFEATFT